eukprot:190859-Heterocapsa_arctica.AAC.1
MGMMGKGGPMGGKMGGMPGQMGVMNPMMQFVSDEKKLKSKTKEGLDFEEEGEKKKLDEMGEMGEMDVMGESPQVTWGACGIGVRASGSAVGGFRTSTLI